jgi:hypothetical protein
MAGYLRAKQAGCGASAFNPCEERPTILKVVQAPSFDTRNGDEPKTR